MTDESPTQNQQQQQKPVGTCKFYGSNSRRPRVYPPRRTTILIDPPESSLFAEDGYKSTKHGAANWTVDSLGSKRFRLHGKVEGNLNRLRMEKDDHDDDNDTVAAPSSSKSKSKPKATGDVKLKPPLVGTKRSRYASLIDDEEEV